MGIRDWWKGEYVPYEPGVKPIRNTSKESRFFDLGYYKRPWLAVIFEPPLKFIGKHWMWFGGIAVSILLALFAKK